MNRKVRRRSSPPAGWSFALAHTRRQRCWLGRQTAGGREQITAGETVRAEGHRLAAPGNQQLRTNYCLDLADRNTLVINPQSERTSYLFDAAGRATLQRLSNLIRVSMAYDAADRLVRLANITSTGTTITSFRDTWDGAAIRLARTEADGTLVTWSYDSTYQLTRERRSGANSYDTTYTYDSAGNRLLKLDNAVRTTFTSDAANQLNKFVNNTGTTTLTYDACGSQRTQQVPSGGITTNTWDFENRLIKVALPTGVVNTFTYNGDGMRVERQDSSGTLKAIWDGEKILEETDQNNVVQVIYTQSGEEFGEVVSQRRSGTSRYFLFDPLGSTSRLTDGSQNVTDSYLFKGFGESLLTAGPTTNPFQFVGRNGYYLDSDLGWNSLRARAYGPIFGRFLSVDPLTFGRRPYLYGSNRPVVAIDPTGRQPLPQNPPIMPHQQSCSLQLCCGPIVTNNVTWKCPAGSPAGLFQMAPCHCFVQFAYMDAGAGGVTVTITTYQGAGVGGQLQCGTGSFPVLAPACMPLGGVISGQNACDAIATCLNNQVTACNNAALPYGACWGTKLFGVPNSSGNSNTAAFQFATCAPGLPGGVPAPPAANPACPAGTPGFGTAPPQFWILPPPPPPPKPKPKPKPNPKPKPKPISEAEELEQLMQMFPFFPPKPPPELPTIEYPPLPWPPVSWENELF